MPSSHVFYYRCPYHRLRNVLTMAVSFDKEDDVYQLSLSYPYSYSRLKNRLNFYQILTSKCNEGSQYKLSSSSIFTSSSSSSSFSSSPSGVMNRRSNMATGRANFSSKHNSSFAASGKQQQRHQLTSPSSPLARSTRGNENINSSKRAKIINWLKNGGGNDEDTGICFRRDCLSMRSLVSVAFAYFSLAPCSSCSRSSCSSSSCLLFLWPLFSWLLLLLLLLLLAQFKIGGNILFKYIDLI